MTVFTNTFKANLSFFTIGIIFYSICASAEGKLYDDRFDPNANYTIGIKTDLGKSDKRIRQHQHMTLGYLGKVGNLERLRVVAHSLEGFFSNRFAVKLGRVVNLGTEARPTQGIAAFPPYSIFT